MTHRGRPQAFLGEMKITVNSCISGTICWPQKLKYNSL